MRDKLTLDPAQAAGPSDIAASDDAVRQALLRLGGGEARMLHARSDRQTPQAVRSNTRHRFVQDGEVAVEYAERARQPAPAPVPPDTTLVDSLREELAQERRARVTAEASARELQISLQACQTRLAHVEITLDEARTRAAAAAEEAIARARVVTTRAPRKPAAAPADAEAEPEPVKWWIKKT